jgi:hypothetical protein
VTIKYGEGEPSRHPEFEKAVDVVVNNKLEPGQTLGLFIEDRDTSRRFLEELQALAFRHKRFNYEFTRYQAENSVWVILLAARKVATDAG